MHRLWEFLRDTFGTTGEIAAAGFTATVDTLRRLIGLFLLVIVLGFFGSWFSPWIPGVIGIAFLFLILMIHITENGLWAIGSLMALELGSRTVPERVSKFFGDIDFDELEILRRYVRGVITLATTGGLMLGLFALQPNWEEAWLVLLQILAVGIYLVSLLSGSSRMSAVRVICVLFIFGVAVYMATYYGDAERNRWIRAWNHQDETETARDAADRNTDARVTYARVISDQGVMDQNGNYIQVPGPNNTQVDLTVRHDSYVQLYNPRPEDIDVETNRTGLIEILVPDQYSNFSNSSVRGFMPRAKLELLNLAQYRAALRPQSAPTSPPPPPAQTQPAPQQQAAVPRGVWPTATFRATNQTPGNLVYYKQDPVTGLIKLGTNYQGRTWRQGGERGATYFVKEESTGQTIRQIDVLYDRLVIKNARGEEMDYKTLPPDDRPVSFSIAKGGEI